MIDEIRKRNEKRREMWNKVCAGGWEVGDDIDVGDAYDDIDKLIGVIERIRDEINLEKLQGAVRFDPISAYMQIKQIIEGDDK